MIYFLIIFICFNISLSIPLSFVDLTHTTNPTIPFFPTQTRFNFTQQIVNWRNNENPFFYATNTFITSEHIGTHIDAPYHFLATGWKVDEIPLKNLVSVHARIIDVSKQCRKNRNYLITIDDIRDNDLDIPEFDEDTGEPFLFVLLFYTGWSKYWPNQMTYGGGESNIEFPGLSEQAITYLIDIHKDNLVGIGIDTLSVDYGLSKTFPVHQVLAKHNKYGLENVALFDDFIKNVKRDLFILDIFPMKIGNGTGAPCRILARLDNLRRNKTNWFGLLVFFFLVFLAGFIAKVVHDFRCNSNKDF